MGIHIASVRLAVMFLAPNSLNSIVLIIAFAAMGCSLLYSEELKQKTCERRIDDPLCERANREEGIADDACIIWQCRKDGEGCERGFRDEDYDNYPDALTCHDKDAGPLDCDDHNDSVYPDAGEICDGIDNNCDGYTDEGLLGKIKFYPIDLQRVDRSGGCDIDHPIQLTVAATQPAPTQTIGAVQQGDADTNSSEKDLAWLADVPEIVEEIENYSTVFEQSDKNLGADVPNLSYQYTNDSGVNKGCPNAIQRCDFHGIGFDPVGNHLLVASESHSNNTCGELRIGFSKNDESVLDLGEVKNDSGDPRLPYIISNGDCDGGASEGVRFPSVATITDTQNEYALFLWLNENARYPRELDCKSSFTSVPLMACGLPIKEMKIDLTVIGENDLFEIGQTTNFEPAALLPWVSDSESKQGFIAAYADQDEKIAFARFDLQSNQGITRSSCSQNGSINRVRHIALAMGNQTDTGVLRVLAAFRKGCDEDAEVGVALYDFDPKESSACAAFACKDLQTLRTSSDGARIATGPVLAYGHVARRMKGNSIGGWVVIWIERRVNEDVLVGFHVVENDDHGLRTLERTPFELVKSESLESPVAFSIINLVSKTNDVFFAVVDNCTTSPIWGRTFCIPEN